MTNIQRYHVLWWTLKSDENYILTNQIDVDLEFSENVWRKEVKFVFPWNQTCQWECWRCLEWKANAGELLSCHRESGPFSQIQQPGSESWSSTVFSPELGINSHSGSWPTENQMTIGLPLFCDVKESRPDVPVFCSSIVGIAGIMASVLLVINIRPFCPHRRYFRSFLADSSDKGVEQPIAGDTAAQRFLSKKKHRHLSSEPEVLRANP